jgi:hypothetical protein
MTRPQRSIIALLTIAAWITISNHCVFAALATTAAAVTPPAASACPFHSQPAKPQPPTTGAQCCKILRALAASPSKIPPCAIVDLAHVDLTYAQPVVAAPANISFPGVFLDTGPPGTTSFAELIGSMRAHAPPLFA